VAALRDGDVLLFVCCQRVLVGHWPDWPCSAISHV